MDSKVLLQHFEQRFGKCSAVGGKEAACFAAPGRVNLIGEHTDYNGGYVFPGAVEQCLMAWVRPNGGTRVRLYAVDLDAECTFDVNDSQMPESVHFRYVYGVVRELMALGVKVEGFDAVYGGDVPLGAGMSSSAALESCFAFALNDLFEGHIDRMELARAGQRTEHKYVGVKCGIMDQFISMHGRAGSLVRLEWVHLIMTGATAASGWPGWRDATHCATALGSSWRL